MQSDKHFISKPTLSLLLLVLFAGACKYDAPLDADTRRAIDSLATEQIKVSKQELDSTCLLAHQNRLPLIVDSLKQARKKQIEDNLKRSASPR
jgi:hypothetical protein